MKGRAISYSAEELQWLEANRMMVVGAYARAFNDRFGRTVDPKNLHALRKRKGWKTGRTGHFAKGNQPANKGKVFPTAATHPNCRKGHFVKGERRGVAAKLYKPIGTERVSKAGYRERKIHDGMPLQSRWRAVHLIEWEGVNGPVPKGFALKCLDGNRQNCDPANWEAIPRALLPRLAGKAGRYKRVLAYDEAPPELRPTILATAKLKHAARLASREPIT